MFRLVATAVLGYVAYRIAREITGSVPDDFGSHLPQQHRRPRSKAATRTAGSRPAAKRRQPAAKPEDATSAGAA